MDASYSRSARRGCRARGARRHLAMRPCHLPWLACLTAADSTALARCSCMYEAAARFLATLCCPSLKFLTSTSTVTCSHFRGRSCWLKDGVGSVMRCKRLCSTVAAAALVLLKEGGVCMCCLAASLCGGEQSVSSDGFVCPIALHPCLCLLVASWPASKKLYGKAIASTSNVSPICSAA